MLACKGILQLYYIVRASAQVRLLRYALLRCRYEGLSPSGQSVKVVRNDNMWYCGDYSLSFRGKTERLDVGIS